MKGIHQSVPLPPTRVVYDAHIPAALKNHPITQDSPLKICLYFLIFIMQANRTSHAILINNSKDRTWSPPPLNKLAAR